MNVSFQLYSARNFTPWEQVLRLLADLGYAEVEGYAEVYHDPAGFSAALKDAGLAMPSAHFSLECLEADPGGAIATSRALGINTIICPYLAPEARPANSAGWVRIATRLAALQHSLAGEDIGFGWHNHDFEFARTPDGAIPMEVLLENAPEIGWEADIAWIARGGGYPMEWISRWGGRIISVHVKDIAAIGECADEDGWADAGEGVMDWPGLMAALRARTAARHWVIEHDNPNDLERFARRSIVNFRDF